MTFCVDLTVICQEWVSQMQRLLNFDWAFVKVKLNAKHSEVFKAILEELTAPKRTTQVPCHTFVFEWQKMVECCGGIEL